MIKIYLTKNVLGHIYLRKANIAEVYQDINNSIADSQA